jgi:hopanoid-associated phosphorylase
VDRLEAAVQAGGRGVISIGIAGGIAPGLNPGDWVVASGVVTDGQRIPTDRQWSQRLLNTIPGAVYADISGVDHPVADRDEKHAVHQATGTVAVDMESHIAATIAARHNVPFAAARVIIDPAERSVPHAALVGMSADGRPDGMAVLRSLAQDPRQLPALLRVIADARAAHASLVRGRRKLGDNLGFPGRTEIRHAPALAGMQLSPSA